MNEMSRKVLEEMSTPALFRLHHELCEELKSRDCTRSGNNVVSDWAETLACKALGLDQSQQSMRGYDAVDGRAQRYQIKARKRSHSTGWRQLGALRGLDGLNSPFDFLVIVLFDEHLDVVRGANVPFAVVKRVARYQRHTNSWIMHATDSLWEEPGIVDLTWKLKAAAAT